MNELWLHDTTVMHIFAFIILSSHQYKTVFSSRLCLMHENKRDAGMEQQERCQGITSCRSAKQPRAAEYMSSG